MSDKNHHIGVTRMKMDAFTFRKWAISRVNLLAIRYLSRIFSDECEGHMDFNQGGTAYEVLDPAAI